LINAAGLTTPATQPIKARRGKGINDDRQANRADARGSAEKEPGNYYWGGPRAHASVTCCVCSVLWSPNSFYDSDHIAADFQGPGWSSSLGPSLCPYSPTSWNLWVRTAVSLRVDGIIGLEASHLTGSTFSLADERSSISERRGGHSHYHRRHNQCYRKDHNYALHYFLTSFPLISKPTTHHEGR
jgi:hypothetical protein